MREQRRSSVRVDDSINILNQLHYSDTNVAIAFRIQMGDGEAYQYLQVLKKFLNRHHYFRSYYMGDVLFKEPITGLSLGYTDSTLKIFNIDIGTK